MKFKVKYVGSKILHDYAGMNYYAAKAMGFSKNKQKNVILIDRKLSKNIKKKTIIHEVCEANLMRKGMKYWSAHLRALKKEKNYYA